MSKRVKEIFTEEAIINTRERVLVQCIHNLEEKIIELEEKVEALEGS